MTPWLWRRACPIVLAVLLALVVEPRTRGEMAELRAWEAVGPTQKPVRRLFTPTSGALFAETDDELFRSDDGGLTWAVVPQPLGTQAVTVSPENHQLLYAAGSTGVYRADDGAASWVQISDQAGRWNRIEVSPADPNVLYGDASTELQGTPVTTIRHERRVSHNAGATWEVTHTYDERRTSGSYPCAYTVRQLQPHATNSARIAAIDGCAVRGDPAARMSYDEGRTSTPFPELDQLVWASTALVGGRGASPDRWYVALFRSNVVYTRIRHSKVMRTDDGASWTTVFEEDSGEPYSPDRRPVDFVSSLTYDPQRPGDVFAVFEHYALNADRYKDLEPVSFTVWMSRDAGATWSDLGARDLPKVSSLTVGIDGRYLYATTGQGVYRLALAE